MPSSMVINTNIASLNSQKFLSRTNDSLQTSMERLSSGLRVNSAKDDAAGLAIADRMTSQIRGMTVAMRNANDGISMAQTAEAGMGTITETLQRMRDLAVQAANRAAVSTEDRQKLQTEFKQLGAEVKRIIQNTEFNGKKILNGSLKNANFQIGANTATDNQISVTVSDLATVNSLSALFGTKLSIGSDATSNNVRSAINAIDTAIRKVDVFRSNLGAIQNRFMTTISNLQSSIENQSSARSRIMDADFASETSNLSRGQILQQAGTAMLAQANKVTQGVLQLLQ
ncbi:flagellin [Methylomonas sp. MED-D]|uniref:Flagellin n=1 Tax=Methylomonas koyamae TaxID=702114 RepID=A0A177NBN1_9GAMM|nr:MULTISPECIES: flagellin [Methylomonas]NJA07712.1 flagellin FliC [Methylococcaceae bacterium WWC4]MDT4332516.1 flagellin [Methylomonas sp. MV1]OAI15251.1 flagellin [Methylomonas koyamae]OHX34667.1 flagellin [Methylomonas sp. LWB]WGS85324.1 flagellin [Methylomonas sp. UP202]